MHRRPAHAATSRSSVVLRLGIVGALVAAAWTVLPTSRPSVEAASGTPIRHIVVIYQENHSFNEVLGYLCVKNHRCKGTLVGKRRDGTTMRLRQAPDIVPGGRHTIKAQRKAMNGGSSRTWCRAGGRTSSSSQAGSTGSPATTPSRPKAIRWARGGGATAIETHRGDLPAGTS